MEAYAELWWLLWRSEMEEGNLSKGKSASVMTWVGVSVDWFGSVNAADFSVKQTADGKLDQRADQLERLVSEEDIRLRVSDKGRGFFVSQLTLQNSHDWTVQKRTRDLPSLTLGPSSRSAPHASEGFLVVWRQLVLCLLEGAQSSVFQRPAGKNIPAIVQWFHFHDERRVLRAGRWELLNQPER